MLTRGQAHDLVRNCETLEELLDLQQHWVGHRDVLPEDDCEELRYSLSEYVDACAFNGDDERSNGPKDSDPTELEEPYTMANAKTRPAELPNAFYTKKLAALHGLTVVGVVSDREGEFFGLRFRGRGKNCVLWLQSDDEGNGRGSFTLENDNG